MLRKLKDYGNDKNNNTWLVRSPSSAVAAAVELQAGGAMEPRAGPLVVLSHAWSRLHRKRAYFTVEPVLFLFMFASFLSYPSFQELLREMVCQRTPNCTSAGNSSRANSSSDSGCGDESSEVDRIVQSETSHWILYANLARGLPAILVSLLFGSLSDQMGRKFFILLPAVGMMANMAVILQVIYIPSIPMGFLLFGSFAAGVYGSFSVMNLAVYSYASDVSVHKRRTVAISMLESMTYLGAALSQVIGGWWIKGGHYAPPFWLILGCSVAIILYVVLALPESLESSMVRHRYPRPTCVRLLSVVSRNLLDFGRLVLSSWKMVVLVLMFFVVEINFLGITDIAILYTMGEPFCWGPDLVGYFLALKVFLNGVAALFALPVLVHLQVPDTGIILTGLLAGGGALVLMGLSRYTWMLFLGRL